jgi:hypothetical protein
MQLECMLATYFLVGEEYTSLKGMKFDNHCVIHFCSY